MDLYAQTRSANGRLPIRNVSLVKEADIRLLAFDLLSPEEVADGVEALNTGEVGLSDVLAATDVVDSDENVLRFARRIGPLFGRSPVESVVSWRVALGIAKQALAIRLGVTEDAGSHGINQRELGYKSSMLSACILTSEVDSTYLQALSLLPIVRRSPEVLACSWSEGKTLVFSVVRPAERGAFLPDSVDILALLGIPNAQRKDAEAHARPLGIRSAGSDEEFLFQLMVTVHLSDARVDPFHGDDRTLVAFGSALSSLWYHVPSELGVRHVARCARCGRPFVLNGSRGMPRKYCGEPCRVAARNERAKRTRRAAREGACDNGSA